MEYRSFADLNLVLADGLRRIPRPVDLIVGIPRSGLLVANFLSLALNVPMTDLDGFLAGRILATGRTRKTSRPPRRICDMERILVVDDSILMGRSMQAARELAQRVPTNAEMVFLAVYGTHRTHPDADIVLEAVPPPRMFQWNILHHRLLEQAFVAIYGVLCETSSKTPSRRDPDSAGFFDDLEPRWIPSQKIGRMVADWPEHVRPQTEGWLARHGIEYGELIMHPAGGSATVPPDEAICRFKAEAYAKSDAMIFIEQDHGPAVEIARMSGKPVLCMRCGALQRPDSFRLRTIKQQVRGFPQRVVRTTEHFTNVEVLKLDIRRLLGNRMYSALKRIAGR